MRFQNRPTAAVYMGSFSDNPVARRNFADIMGTIQPTGTPGMTSVIQGADLNAFPVAFRTLLSDWWENCPCGPGERPCLPIIGEINGWEYVENVDAPPTGYANADERGDRVYFWTGSGYYFATWDGRFFIEPNDNWFVDGPSSLETSTSLAIPSGTMINGSYWVAGDVTNPAGSIVLPDEKVSCDTLAGGNGGEPAGNNLQSPGLTLAGPAVVLLVAGLFLYSRNR